MRGKDGHWSTTTERQGIIKMSKLKGLILIRGCYCVIVLAGVKSLFTEGRVVLIPLKEIVPKWFYIISTRVWIL